MVDVKMIQPFNVRFGLNVMIFWQRALYQIVDAAANVALVKLNIVGWKV